MSNAPATWELYQLAPGEKKVTERKDTKIPNAASFDVKKEDHTLGNLLRMQLLKNSKVRFAGYKMPHPLDHSFVLKVQTTPETSPLEVLQTDINKLIREVGDIKRTFQNQLTLKGLNQTEAAGGPSLYQTVDRAY
ncbi:DNA-directed RNA polymerase [Phlyctochytrium arcticum]|nr:DNA-directed RNA polymerase [Phlyctochytrium arcticum]